MAPPPKKNESRAREIGRDRQALAFGINPMNSGPHRFFFGWRSRHLQKPQRRGGRSGEIDECSIVTADVGRGDRGRSSSARFWNSLWVLMRRRRHGGVSFLGCPGCPGCPGLMRRRQKASDLLFSELGYLRSYGPPEFCGFWIW